MGARALPHVPLRATVLPIAPPVKATPSPSRHPAAARRRIRIERGVTTNEARVLSPFSADGRGHTVFPMAAQLVRTAPGMWAVVELRRRWRALVVLGLLAGMTVGLAMAALAGARRTDLAWERLRGVTNASDALVFTSQAGLYSDDELDYDHLAQLPYVKAAGAFGLAYAAEGEVFMASYGDWLDAVDRPRIIRGRAPNRQDLTEVVVSAPGHRLGGDPAPELGDELTMSFFTREQQHANRLDDPEGPTVTFRVVGISESPFEIGAIPSHGDVYVGPAFRERYGTGLASFSNLAVRLAEPARDLPLLEAEVARLYPDRNVPVYDLAAAGKRVTNGTALERSGLLLFAAAVALAGLVIVGQALTRSVRAAGADVPVLVAVGFTRRDAARALSLPYLLSVAVAAVSAVAGAIALSPRFPIGLGRRVDPDVGLHVDLAVLGPGALLLAGVLVSAVVVTAWRATAEAGRIEIPRRSLTVSALARLGAPVVAVTGPIWRSNGVGATVPCRRAPPSSPQWPVSRASSAHSPSPPGSATRSSTGSGSDPCGTWR
jgi:hypothetical protein